MPVIRGQVRGRNLTEAQRNSMLEKLHNELFGKPLRGKNASENPLIFEIPLERLDGTADRIDVLVVWDAFRDVRSDERTALILDAYGGQAEKVAQAMGATLDEAMEQGLLPYRIVHIQWPDEFDSAEMNGALLDEGAFELGGHLELYLPTRKMAEAALVHLNQRVPNGRWGIGEYVLS